MNSRLHTKRNNAFSLVELSIVLVILGLLVGGILAGQSLIRASELRAVTAEQQRYSTAVTAFRDKYFGLPGDIANATSIWGTDSLGCPTGGGTGTCNGNGDGFVIGETNTPSYWAAPNERPRFWQHLALAGLIEGNYSGIPIAGTWNSTVLGVNNPGSKIAGAMWIPRDNQRNMWTGNPSFYSIIPYSRALTFTGNGVNEYVPVLRPEEAWNIDKKMDDGMPGAGKIIAYYWNYCTTAASATDFAGNYAVNYTDLRCGLFFMNSY